MSKDKKPDKTGDKKTKPDVSRPGKSAPSSTSKPVIVTNRPILKDPMMIDVKSEDEGSGEDNLAHGSGPKLQPLAEQAAQEPEDHPEEKPAEEKDLPSPPEPEAQPDTEPAADRAQEPKPEAEPKLEEKGKEEAAERTKQEAAVRELIDSRKYELPINSVEKRKAKHFVVLGILLAVLLALAWADIALDAGLIHISGVKPVTHLFSN